MARTDAQRVADEKLTEAFLEVAKAYFSEQNMGVLTDYVMVAAFHNYDADGDPVTHVMSHPRDGDLPIYRVLGLLEYAAASDKGVIAGVEEEDDG